MLRAVKITAITARLNSKRESLIIITEEKMRKILLMSSALVLLSGTAEAACIQTPSCSSLGYSSSSSCSGGVKCPFGNAWNCDAINKINSLNSQITNLTNKITEQTNTITNLETQITEIRKEVTTSNCLVGDILYSRQSAWCLTIVENWL